jgi:hypothetical protein
MSRREHAPEDAEVKEGVGMTRISEALEGRKKGAPAPGVIPVPWAMGSTLGTRRVPESTTLSLSMDDAEDPLLHFSVQRAVSQCFEARMSEFVPEGVLDFFVLAPPPEREGI